MSRILVIGATGLLGAALVRRFRERGHEVFGTRFSQAEPGLEALDIRDGAAVARCLGSVGPEATLLPASIPHVDGCELRPAETRAVNVEGTANVARAAAAVGSRLVFFSSDYVFDGEGEPYAEDAPVRPMNEYGRQKAEAERIVESALPGRFLVARVSGLYGPERRQKNFVYRLLRAAAKGERVPAPTDQVYHPTEADGAAAVVEALVAGRRSGIYHAVGPDRLTRFELAEAVCSVFGLDRAALLSPVRLADLRSPAPRPARTGLRTDKVRRDAGFGPPPLREGLERMKAAIAAAGGASLTAEMES
jgi:dTDP-4-dehydrorhamnose reductase